MVHRVHIAGESGRLGGTLAALVREHPAFTLTDAAEAETICVALPRRVATPVIEAAGARTVIDLSGDLKARAEGRYALLLEPGHARLIDGAPPRPGDRLANPGCIASAVILGVHRRLREATRLGPLHVTAIGGRSMAGRDQEGALRLARRLGPRHPHHAEIERALPGVTLASLTPLVTYPLERGLMVVISAEAEGLTSDPPGDDLDARDVIETPRVATRLHVEGDTVTLAVAIDNLTLPAHNARRLLEALAQKS